MSIYNNNINDGIVVGFPNISKCLIMKVQFIKNI